MLFYIHKLRIDVRKYVKIVDGDFCSCLEYSPSLVSNMMSLGYSIWVIMYPQKLNFAVLASAKIVSCIVTVKTVNIVWLFLGVNLITALSYRSNWQLFWDTTSQKVCPFSEFRHSPCLALHRWPESRINSDDMHSIGSLWEWF